MKQYFLRKSREFELFTSCIGFTNKDKNLIILNPYSPIIVRYLDRRTHSYLYCCLPTSTIKLKNRKITDKVSKKGQKDKRSYTTDIKFIHLLIVFNFYKYMTNFGIYIS